MRSKTWVLFVCLHCFAFVAVAQNPAKRQLVLQLSSGGFVSFKSETSVTDNKRAAESQSLASLIYSQALTSDNRIIHRVLTDAEGRVIFGYDLVVSANAITKKFSLGVLPADEAFRRTFLKESAQRSNESFATFPRSATPQTLDDGDAVSLELLVNPESGVKIVDVVRVTFDRSRLFDTHPMQFLRTSLSTATLTVKNYQLWMDDKLVARSKSTFGRRGSLLWLYVPDRGRFIFSLGPRDGYSFEKVGVLDDNRIEFMLSGERYEWFSSASILPNGGTWNLWVLFDPTYTPLFSTSNPITQPPGVLQKIERAMIDRSVGVGAGLINGQPKSNTGKGPAISARVMVGGAESMDNLLPKTP